MTASPLHVDFDWEHEGRVLGEMLDAAHAVVVLGQDPDATARVALGIGRSQARRRRVAVGDLLGEAAPIQALIPSEDPHGISDTFAYGVSINRIAHAVPDAGELFVMPSGTESLDYEEVLPSERWRRLANGFRAEGALLVLAAPATAPALERLVAMTDGAVLVGDVVPPKLPVSQVIGSVRRPRESAAPGAPLPARPRPVPAPRASSGRAAQMAAGLVLAAAIGGFGVWLARRPLDHSVERPTRPPRGTTGAPAALAAARTDSAAGSTTARPDSLPALAVANAADSVQSAAWVVELVKENTLAGAMASLARVRERLPAATIGAVTVNDGTWYRLVGGAFVLRPTADSLLVTLRRAGMLDARTGLVARLPLAFLVQRGVAADDAARLLEPLQQRGLAAYALRQRDGTANLYVGAFETPEEAAIVAPALRRANIAPTLVYRLGRVF